MKSRILPMLGLVIGAAVLARGVAAQPSVTFETLGWFDGVAVDPATDRVYITADGIGAGIGPGVSGVVILNGASNELVATVPVISGAGLVNGIGAVDVNSTTSRVYVTVPGGWPFSHNAGSVSVIDGTTNTVVATVPVGLSPLGVAVNPTTNLIYVANIDSNDVSVIDGGSNTVVATIPVGQWPMGVAVNPTTNLIYVAGGAAWSGTVSVIDGGTNTVVATIPAGYAPQRVAVNPNTNSIYAVPATYGGPFHTGHDGLLAIDGTTNTVVATLPATDADDVAVNPTTNHVFLAHGGNVTVIDGATNSPLYDVVDAYGESLAVNPVTSVVYAVSTVAMLPVSFMYVFHDSPGAAPPPAPSPTPAPPPTPTPTPCLPAPAPPLAEGMEWVALQCRTCNAVTTTYPDSTPVGTIAGAVAPPGTLEWLWRFGGDTWQGWSPAFPQASDLAEVDRLDVVSICVEGSATFTRPVI